MVFTVEIKRIEDLARCEVEIYLDRAAMEDLLKQLSFLKARGDHSHFFTPSWGGSPLTEERQVDDNTLVNHLRITLL